MPTPTPILPAVKLLKGALIAPEPDIYVPFQYNPHEVSRSLTPQVYTKSAPAEVRFIGGPTESISLTAYITCAEEMASGTAKLGILNELAALEQLINPTSKEVSAYRKAVMQDSTRWAVPPKAASTFFSWGPARVLPVQVKEMSVKEDLFGLKLYPFRAEVSLKLDVVPVQDADDKQYSIQLQNLKQIEKRAKDARAKVKDDASAIGRVK